MIYVRQSINQSIAMSGVLNNRPLAMLYVTMTACECFIITAFVGFAAPVVALFAID